MRVNFGALRESEVKNRQRILEFERDAERTRAVIEEYTQKIQDWKSEVSALTEADAKNTKRILELEKDTERYRHSMKQYIRQLEGTGQGHGDRNESDKYDRSQLNTTIRGNPDIPVLPLFPLPHSCQGAERISFWTITNFPCRIPES